MLKVDINAVPGRCILASYPYLDRLYIDSLLVQK